MYYYLYQTIKQRLADAFGLTLDPETGEVTDASESEVKAIRWFNEPYEREGIPDTAAGVSNTATGIPGTAAGVSRTAAGVSSMAAGLPGMATIFVECAPVDLSPETKLARSRSLTVRLHVVSPVAGGSEGKVRDADIEAHEAMAHRVLECLQQQRLPFDGHETRPLRPVSWTPQPKYPGYLMTWIEFRTKG